MTRVGKTPTKSKSAKKSGSREKPSKSAREKTEDERKRLRAAAGAKAKAKAKAKATAATKVKPKVAAGVKMKPKATTAAKVKPKATAAAKVKPKATATAKMKPRVAAGARMKPKAAAGAKMKLKVGAAAKVKPKATAAAKVKRKAPKNIQETDRSKSARLRQQRAHKSVFFYAAKLGKRKAAARLDATVAELETWLKKGFPQKKIEDAIGLGRVGGSFTVVQKTDLEKLKKKISGKKLAKLTGISEAEINGRIKAAKKAKKPAYVRFQRDALRRAQKELGKEKLSELLGVKERLLDAARKVPQTLLTSRLVKFTALYETAGIASMLGLSEATIKRWLATNVPRKWESEVVALIGRRPDQGVSEEKLIKPRKKRDLGKILKESWKKAKKWSERVSPSFRISQKTVERWVRIGKFDENFEAAKASYAESRRSVPAYELPPEPPATPEPPEPSLFKKPLPPLPKPPRAQKIPKKITEIEQYAIAEFHESRAEAFFKGLPDEHRPPDPWGRPKYVELSHRRVWRVFKKVEKFSHLLNMGKIGNEIIEGARRMWPKITGRNEYMTIRFTFSALGTGNPFYPEAWFPDKENFGFFTRSTDVIYDVREIDFRVRAILNEVWDVTKEIGLLFMEHYEIVKSTSK
jgi:hypothetical protein